MPQNVAAVGDAGLSRLPRLGDLLGPYRLVEGLETGGYTVIFRAVDDREGNEVALKTPLLGPFADDDVRESLRHEARVLKHLDTHLDTDFDTDLDTDLDTAAAPRFVDLLEEPAARAVGVTLYLAATGRLPFRGVSQNEQDELKDAILRGRPKAPSHWIPALSGDLDRAVLGLLDPDPGRRGRRCDLEAPDSDGLAEVVVAPHSSSNVTCASSPVSTATVRPGATTPSPPARTR